VRPPDGSKFDLSRAQVYKAAVRASDFVFSLPEDLIAQTPAASRDQSRLLVLHRATGRIEHRCFRVFPELLHAGDVLVVNDSQVIPARLRGTAGLRGAPVEILLLRQEAVNDWWGMVKPGKRARTGGRITLRDRAGQATNIRATVLDVNREGHRRLRFTGTPNIAACLPQLGEVPLPPYIKREPNDDLSADFERYQTVYARAAGSVAAPTAGLHFTLPMLDRIRALGASVCALTLHVGWGTFAPVKTEQLSDHVMHREQFSVRAETARELNAAKAQGRRVVAVGTTTVRVLETLAAAHRGPIVPGPDSTRLFIYPPYQFQIVDALLTNFHLPRSTLLMLVSAFAAPGETRGRDLVLAAYAEAVRERYRFFSYGDAMLIL
jgi:S-adenosylmethionine:tRNA ribosyltransferase-isomerase